MRRPARKALAVMMVATALCADRAVVAATHAPEVSQPQQVSALSRLASRLGKTFSRTLRIDLPARAEFSIAQSAGAPRRVVVSLGCPARPILSHLELHLPPPAALVA